MKVFFKGFYGFKNLGDDIFVHAINWFCQNNDIDYLIHGYNLPYGIKGKNVKNKYQKNLLDFVYSLKANEIVYWGGSTFESISRKTDLKNIINRFGFLKNKVSLFSISLGPFKNKIEENKALDFINELKYVGVRDKKSLSYSENTNFTFDVAILSPLIFKSQKENENKVNNKKIISLNISDAKNYNEYTQIYLNYLIENKIDIAEVNVLVFNPDDYNKSEFIYKKLKNNHINCNFYDYTSDSKKLIDLISKSDFLLGNRLHSGILAYAYDVPFILNEYHSKCTEFLNTIGHEFKIHDLNKLKLDFDQISKECKPKIKSTYFRNITLTELNNLERIINYK